jgi:molybdopterin synthase sulfur carrier subunit
MSIKVRYFASLKENVGRPEDNLEASGVTTVKDVWRRANPDKPLPSNSLAAVNMDYVDLDSAVKDGDEVAFFPPVTGG